jgi:allophanate hydrolase
LSVDLPAVVGLDAIRALYDRGADPRAVIAAAMARIDAGDPAAFITRATSARIDAAIAALLARAPRPNSLPLWGVPFAVKDNIDVAGMPTTCACPEFSRMAGEDAAVVARLVAAGAIPVGKTNLDQFATGLNGTRSPYGAPHCVFSPAHVPGGSSSGSAVAVASGMVCFALGTDTAGSGRVPAALNNLVGIKPTPGLLSVRGVVPACESLDCVTVFALSVADGALVRRLAEGYDPADPWSRRAVPHAFSSPLRVGVLAPQDRVFLGRGDNARLYEDAIAGCGGTPVMIDYAPFRETAALLYDDAWVAERQEAFARFGLPDSVLDPSVRAIFAKGKAVTGVQVFAGFHRLAALRRACEDQMARVDVLLLPTCPGHVTLDEMRAEPITRNAMLGLYTNFCNFLGLAAIAVPAGFAEGLPFGVMLVAPGFGDAALEPLADRLHRRAGCGAGVDRADFVPPALPPVPFPDRLSIAVVGAHLSGMPLNGELLVLGGRLERAAQTTPDYRLCVIPGAVPPKPGLLHVPGAGGAGIVLEIWSLPPEGFGRFVAAIPSPLGIGRVRLADGGEVSAFLCEAWALEGAQDITALGGWRAYVMSAGS